MYVRPSLEETTYKTKASVVSSGLKGTEQMALSNPVSCPPEMVLVSSESSLVSCREFPSFDLWDPILSEKQAFFSGS